ncbi:DUF4386 domain-containing protein [Natronorubrum sp. FCH18a]|uniref:DUF4386 domain-containing protein n=1 Tax=Natronorubrum sp. FCH18a TaxID=3447018 RepID=UPI003F51A8CC
MNKYKWNARIAGALIIAGYVTYGIPDVAILQPLFGTSDVLTSISENEIQVTMAALIMAINCAAVVVISLALYPALKEYSEPIALSYVVTRVFESIVMAVGIICLLLLVPLSQEYVQANAAATSSLQAVGVLAIQGNFLAYHVAMIGLAVGSLPFCYLLYRTELVPRIIPVLGLIGYPALLALMVVEIFNPGVDPMIYVLYVPGAIFELGLAVWLIMRGFSSPVSVSKDESPVVPEPQNSTR